MGIRKGVSWWFGGEERETAGCLPRWSAWWPLMGGTMTPYKRHCFPLSLSFFFSTCKRKGDRGALTWAMVADEWRSGDSVCKCERRTSVDATVLMWLALAASEGGWSLPPSRTTTGALELSASVARPRSCAHIFPAVTVLTTPSVDRCAVPCARLPPALLPANFTSPIHFVDPRRRLPSNHTIDYFTPITSFTAILTNPTALPPI